jgi:anti-anti-sigma factor
MSDAEREVQFQLLTLRSSRAGDTHVVSAGGELDMATSQALETELGLAGDSDARTVLLDLSGLTFMDCAALRVILGFDERSKDRPGRLVIQPGPPNVHRVFSITSAARQLRFVS